MSVQFLVFFFCISAFVLLEDKELGVLLKGLLVHQDGE